ncbi:ATP-binding cassette sub-family G member 4 [Halotydeus destructor]|nr:ATP-binding cassette sub-family G member 4 [Halotydeus destructor]
MSSSIRSNPSSSDRPLSPAEHMAEMLTYDPDFEVTWDNLEYIVPTTLKNKLVSAIFTPKQPVEPNIVLKNIFGSFRRGHLTAILGSRGSGKTSLLECLAATRDTELLGNVSLVNATKVRVSYVEAQNSLSQVLTVREYMLMVARMRRFDKAKEPFVNIALTDTTSSTASLTRSNAAAEGTIHMNLISDLLIQFGLSSCSEHMVADLSESQRKRLSISLELLFQPNVLLLDEPTSELDFASSTLLIEMLRNLAKSTPRIAVVLTMRHPTSAILNMFHKLYILSPLTGKAIFEGPPEAMVDYLATFKLYCPKYCNPLNFVVSIACGQNGMTIVKQLGKEQERVYKELAKMSTSSMVKVSLVTAMARKRAVFDFHHCWYIFARSLRVTLRDHWSLGYRAVVSLLSLLLLWFMFRDVGHEDGCPLQLDTMLNASVIPDTLDHLDSIRRRLANNDAAIFVSLMLFTAIHLVFTVAAMSPELTIVKKERLNGWYTFTSYYVGKTCMDSILLAFLATCHGLAFHIVTGQPREWSRVARSLVMLLLTCPLIQSQGVIISAISGRQLRNAGTLVLILLTLVACSSHFFSRDHVKPCDWSRLSYSRAIMENMHIAYYGDSRCQVMTQLHINATVESLEKTSNKI